jgi:hypothetical protein
MLVEFENEDDRLKKMNRTVVCPQGNNEVVYAAKRGHLDRHNHRRITPSVLSGILMRAVLTTLQQLHRKHWSSLTESSLKQQTSLLMRMMWQMVALFPM